jgi:hypothetical protein
MSPESSQTKKYMAGILMSLLHGNLHKLSTENFQNLLNYYATGTLTLADREFTPKRSNRNLGYIAGATH